MQCGHFNLGTFQLEYTCWSVILMFSQCPFLTFSSCLITVIVFPVYHLCSLSSTLHSFLSLECAAACMSPLEPLCTGYVRVNGQCHLADAVNRGGGFLTPPAEPVSARLFVSNGNGKRCQRNGLLKLVPLFLDLFRPSEILFSTAWSPIQTVSEYAG